MQGHTTGTYDCVFDEAGIRQAMKKCRLRKPTGQTGDEIERAYDLARAKRERKAAKRLGAM